MNDQQPPPGAAPVWMQIGQCRLVRVISVLISCDRDLFVAERLFPRVSRPKELRLPWNVGALQHAADSVSESPPASLTLRPGEAAVFLCARRRVGYGSGAWPDRRSRLYQPNVHAAIRNLVGAFRREGSASIAHARRYYGRDAQRILTPYSPVERVRTAVKLV